MSKNTDGNTTALLAFWGVVIAAMIALVGSIYNVNTQREIEREKSCCLAILHQTSEAQRTLFANQNVVTPTNTSIPLISTSSATITLLYPIPPLKTDFQVLPFGRVLHHYPLQLLLEAAGKSHFYSNRDNHLQLYLINSDGSNEQRLTYNEYDDGTPKVVA